MKKIDYPESVKILVSELKCLPGIGIRSAERMAIWLLQSPKADPEAMAKALHFAKNDIVSCGKCGFFSTRETCAVCDDGDRDDLLICVVEQATDVLPIERSGVFRGRYHCLGGKLSPLDHVTPDDLKIGSLINRVKEGMEIILALGSDVEGEATANYIASLLKNKPVKITRIAQGLPVGGGLEYADDLTLMRAMNGRRDISFY
jgi:recombination protein RecR